MATPRGTASCTMARICSRCEGVRFNSFCAFSTICATTSCVPTFACTWARASPPFMATAPTPTTADSASAVCQFFHPGFAVCFSCLFTVCMFAFYLCASGFGSRLTRYSDKATCVACVRACQTCVSVCQSFLTFPDTRLVGVALK